MLLSLVPPPEQPIMLPPAAGKPGRPRAAVPGMTRGRIDRMAPPPGTGPGRGTDRDDEPAEGNREPEPFDAFYRREFPRMVTLACAVSGSRVAAEDIAQDALIAARQRWDTVGGYDKPGAWVRRVTIQLAGKRLRRARAEAAAWLRLAPTGPTQPIPPGPDE